MMPACFYTNYLFYIAYVVLWEAYGTAFLGEISERAKWNAINKSEDLLKNKIGCQKRFYKPSKVDSSAEDSFVCVCNGTYCDEPEPVGNLKEGQVVYFTSSRDEHRLRRQSIQFLNQTELDGARSSPETVTIRVDASKHYQEILGFGGAFTDAAGIQFNSLSPNTAQKLLEAYFGEHGINYTVGRVPIASCDFSTREYSYLDKADDFNLTTFSLAPEDMKFKIPYILKAWKLSKGKLKLFGSPWSAPAWMKTNERMKGGGQLKGDFNGKYYETYAKYFLRFLEEYWKHGVKFWGLTIQNEPGSGLDPFWGWQTMYLSSQMQVEFAHKLLSPVLKASEIGMNVKIMAHDDQRNGLLDAAKAIYSNEEKAKAIDGTGSHWYSHSDYSVLSDVHNIQPNKFILATEACTGYAPGEHVPLLGDWHRAEEYAYDILQNLRNWVVGWTDWNMALDLQGGPNWVGNFVDAPILVNATADQFIKQPMFYALAHFSRFVPPGSLRIDSSNSTMPDNSIQHVAFRTPDGRRVLVLLNTHPSQAISVQLVDEKWAGTRTAEIGIPAKSFVTAVWAKPS
ncbi:glycosyl hydrolase family 30 TIM-barrel domain-containing protein [Ditylenchus destructor]|nr:glycosyl hydrolase family 30 TIM-barrel domain-containing protein [Ditylenchus destructor]